MKVQKKKEIFEGKSFPFTTSIQQNRPVLVGAHWHEHLEFIRILREPVTLQIDSCTFEARQGEIYFINSNQIHSAESRVNGQTGNGALLGLVFDKSVLFHVAESFALRHAYVLFAGPNTIRNKYTPDELHWKELDEAMDRAFQEFGKLEPAYEFAVLACLYRMMAPVLRLHLYEAGNRASDLHAAYFHRLKPALDYMERHCTGKVYMEEVGRTVNMSPHHFSSMFKKTFGFPPVRYLTSLRIERAKRLLLDQESSVTEIAERCGFCNVNYFDKVFKEQSGFTPMEYRKRFAPTC